MPLQFVAQGPMALPAASSALGIGDVVAGATFFAGLRVYSTAKIGTNALLIQRTSDTTNATLVFKSNGFIDCTNVNGSGQILSVWRDANGAGTLLCVRVYEQISGTSSGNAAAVLNIVDETMGVLTLGSDTNNQHYDWSGLTGITTSGGKFTLVGTAKHKSGAANSAIVGSFSGATNWQLGLDNAGSQCSAYQDTAATPVLAPCADDAWHGICASLDHANSFTYINATKTATDTGTSANITTNDPSFMSSSGFNPFQGRAFEAAVYGSALSDANAQLITSNIAAMITSAGLT